MSMKDIARDLVARHPNQTANELEKIAGYTNGQIRKRLNDLRHEGEVYNPASRICSVTETRAFIWRLVSGRNRTRSQRG